ncbi:MAG: YmdB family metallophosphoesterase, partial [Spirochaetaceae bacterium]|nr:YmdB family metallophosphoesterase [Spirochaetaceae bacterium]
AASEAPAAPGGSGTPAAAAKSSSPGVGIISLLGQAGFNRVHLRNPFEMAGGLIERVKQQTPLVLVDFHATTTSEKVAMSLFLDGKVSALIGTHVRTLSADARLLPGGTAAITHSGRTGSLNSVGGLDPEVETRKFLTQVHEQSRDAWGLLELQAVVLEVGADGAARSISTLRRQTTAPEAARKAADAARNRGPGRTRRASGRR